jgi:formate C-acetyltransferase
VTAGGAHYNGSGVQGVGLADLADALAGLHEVVFRQRRHTLQEVVAAMRSDFRDAPRLHASLTGAPKFGNDEPLPDGYAERLAERFRSSLARHRNTRGGPYVPGFYSSTCHVGFGARTGGLPSGRRAGAPFAASLGASNGRDRKGPTALLGSVARIAPQAASNGYAVNLHFDPAMVGGEQGLAVLTGLTRGFFAAGGQELQINVVSAEQLEEARRHPGLHPGLVVRVAGYCAYFDDLPDAVKAEIIARTRQAA